MMQVEIPNPSASGNPIDGRDDSKYLTNLSTLLVATVQEIKDRVSHIEFLFCSEIFPGFQSQTKSLKTQIDVARELATAEWRHRESDLLRQVEESRCLLRGLEDERDTLLREKEDLKSKCESLEVEKSDAEERFATEMVVKVKEFIVEKGKRRRLSDNFKEVIGKYKHLKSQYKFLLKKCGHSMEEAESDENTGRSPALPSRLRKDGDEISKFEKQDEDITPLDSQQNDHKNVSSSIETLQILKDSSSIVKGENARCSKTPTSIISDLANRPPSTEKSMQTVVGTKRSRTFWRDTRANQDKRGIDPHDDFLDTPLENIRENFKKAGKEDNKQDINVRSPQVMDFDCSDDKKQELIDQVQKKPPISVAKSGNTGFKYVEPVRKKADRENLKGIDCKQCKKFYDAVHPHGGTGDSSHGGRCEHQDSVSRHRYKYAPPLTPEGFWNIGFDTET